MAVDYITNQECSNQEWIAREDGQAGLPCPVDVEAPADLSGTARAKGQTGGGHHGPEGGSDGGVATCSRSMVLAGADNQAADEWGDGYLITKEAYEAFSQAATAVLRFYCRSGRKASSGRSGRKSPAPGTAVGAEGMGEIGRKIYDDVRAGCTSLHTSPPSAGKTEGCLEVIEVVFRYGGRALIACHSVAACDEFVERLRTRLPEAFEDDAVAMIFGRPAGVSSLARYPITTETRIVICTHVQIHRRGWSRFLSGLMRAISPKEEDEDFVPFHILIDEASAYIQSCRHEIPLDHRAKMKRLPDGTGYWHNPVRECPRSARNGRCDNCTFRDFGGHIDFNDFDHRQNKLPRSIKTHLERLPSAPHDAFTVKLGEDGLQLDDEVEIGITTFASRVMAYREDEIDPDRWTSLEIDIFRREEGIDWHPVETNEEVLASLLGFAHNPVLVRDRAVTQGGVPISATTLAKRIAQDERNWHKDITFPSAACEVRRLLLTDVMPIEAMRRYAEEHGTGLVFLEGTPLDADLEVLHAVFPELVERAHPHSSRKIRQVAVMTMSGRVSINSLVSEDRHLVTSRLEKHGGVLIFSSVKKEAEELYKRIRTNEKSCGLVDGNDILCCHPVRSAGEFRCWIAYMRSVLSRAVNLVGMVTIVVDASSFRPISSFNPSSMAKDEFQRSRDDEHLSLLLQVIGRILRGDAEKRAAVIVLNAPSGLTRTLPECPVFREACKLTPIFREGDDILQVVDQFDRWLAGEGDEFPPPNPELRRPKGRPRAGRDEREKRAIQMAQEGQKWSAIYSNLNLKRLAEEDRERIRLVCSQKT